MIQNTYALPDLIDLALKVPEPGFVNFNIIHTVLHAIVKELGLTDVRPWCHIENDLLTKTELTKAKLKESARDRFLREKFTEGRTDPVPQAGISKSRIEEVISLDTGDKPQNKQDATPQAEEKHVREQVTETEGTELPETSEETLTVEKAAQDETPAENLKQPPTAENASQTQLDVTPPSDETQAEERKDSLPATKKDFAIQVEVKEDEAQKVLPPPAPVIAPREKIKDREFAERFIFEVPELPEPDPELVAEASKRPLRAGESLRYRQVDMRVNATEEGLHRLSNIVDILADKMKKAELRRKAGFSSEELEILDERITDLEETIARLLADHELLMELDKLLRDMLAEFEEIKALAALLKQMQLDISKKADKEETWAALALKGDLDLVNRKVDQLEFETAIEELGEAIGLLGIKFTIKNDEWEERASEIWRGIDSKMSRDVFDKAMSKLDTYLAALMTGLAKVKKVVEDLLYPEASGVTRCILCRRPACISGLECMGIFDSFKRPHSDKSSEDDDSNKLRETLDDAQRKKQKLEAPPYCKSRDTIISIAYSSSSYRSTIEKMPKIIETPQMKLMPKSKKSHLATSKKTTEIPKLPNIGDKSSADKPQKRRPYAMKSKSKPQTQTDELKFINKSLAKFEREEKQKNKEEKMLPQKIRCTVVLEPEPSRKSESRSSASTRSSVSSVDMAPDPDKALESFSPARLMPDSSRKDILLSPSSKKEQKFDLALSPLQFDSDAHKK